MDKFLSCDWGTSFFRLRLVQYDTLEVVAEEKDYRGIAGMFNDWKNSNGRAEDKLLFYSNVITEAIQKISTQINLNLDGIPVIISGMAASTIGMINLPYKEIPVPIDGWGLEIKKPTIPQSKNEFIIISGIRTMDDVIRGEETKIVGCASYLNDEQLIVFTGTHPKHVTIKNKTVTGIKTYMTGEFFNLLVNHSVLAASVKVNDDFFNASNQTYFTKGVRESPVDNLLHTAFTVRTNDILKNIPKENNYYYLSGLLIGTELRDLINYNHPVYLCGNAELITFYQLACDVLEITISSQINGDEALLKGQKAIYTNYVSN